LVVLNLSLNEALALLNVLLQVSNGLGDKVLLVVGDLTDGEDLLNTVGAELNVSGEELNTLVSIDGGLDESGLNNTLLALGGLEKAVSETSTSESHGESGRASSVLGLDNFVATELNSVGKSIKFLLGELLTSLGEEGNNGDTGVTTNDSDVHILGVLALNLRDEAGGTDNIKGGDTEKTLGVVDTVLLEDLSEDGNGRVDGVGDDEEVGLGAVLGAGFSEITDNTSVGVEKIITGHTGLSGDTSRDNNDFRTLKGLLETVILRSEASNLGVGVDVAQISSNTGRVDNIVQGEVSDSGVVLEEKGERLANTTSSTENGNLGKVGSGGGEGALNSDGRENTGGSKHSF